MNKIRSHICTKTFGLTSYFPYLSLGEREFFFTKLTVCCFFVFQPNHPLGGRKSINVNAQVGHTKNHVRNIFKNILLDYIDESKMVLFLRDT